MDFQPQKDITSGCFIKQIEKKEKENKNVKNEFAFEFVMGCRAMQNVNTLNISVILFVVQLCGHSCGGRSFKKAA